MKFLTFFLLSISFFFTPKKTGDDIKITKTKDINENGILYKIEFKNNIDRKNLVFDTQTTFLKNIDFYNHKKELLPKKLISLKKHVYEVKNTHQNIYYTRIEYYKKEYLPLIIYNVHNYYGNNRVFNILDGIYIGFFFMVFLLNIFFYLSIKDNVFLYYIAFLVCINIAVISLDGYLLTIIKNPLLYKAVLVIKYLVPVSGALFAIKFLNLNTKTPLIVGALFSVLTLGLYIATNVSGNFIYESLADLFAFFHLIVFWSFGVKQYKKNPYAKFFVIGYSIILFSSMFYIIPENFNFQAIKLSLNHLKLGAIFEMVILTYAISYRVKIIQEELVKVQEQLTEYLNQLKTQESDNQKITDALSKKHNLSKREEEVLYYLLQQYTYKQISETLFISAHTVKYHVGNLYKKLNIKNRQEISKVHVVNS